MLAGLIQFPPAIDACRDRFSGRLRDHGAAAIIVATRTNPGSAVGALAPMSHAVRLAAPLELIARGTRCLIPARQ
ncbi:MAG: hypothetical protein CMJ84_07385 [Planctomycetes bacterium]|nr:hypothetical protein [Planctomycetota bacterium]